MRYFSIFIVFAFAALLLVGGAFAYVKAGSLISLITSVLSGLVMVLSAVAMLKNKTFGGALALIVAFVLVIVFGFRFVLSARFMPAGLMLIASSVVALILALFLRAQKKSV